MIFISTLVFATVVLGIAGLYVGLAPNRMAQRLQALGPQETEDPSRWTETFAKLAGPFARLSTPKGDWDTSPLRLRFLNAGIRSEDARLIYFGAKTALPLVFALGMFALLRGSTQGTGLLFYVLLAAVVGVYLPNVVVARLVRKRQREIFENFPDAADLMLVCVEAGLGLDSALSRVADEMRRKSMATAEELQLTNLELRAGASREQSLRNMATRTGVEEILAFCSMLTQADKFGTSIADSLRVFSDDLRHKRQVRAEDKAAKIPTKMLFPLVLFIFPSIIMVVLGPAIIQMIRTLVPAIMGQG